MKKVKLEVKMSYGAVFQERHKIQYIWVQNLQSLEWFQILIKFPIKWDVICLNWSNNDHFINCQTCPDYVQASLYCSGSFY
jgi:hypothetical protein